MRERMKVLFRIFHLKPSYWIIYGNNLFESYNARYTLVNNRTHNSARADSAFLGDNLVGTHWVVQYTSTSVVSALSIGV